MEVRMSDIISCSVKNYLTTNNICIVSDSEELLELCSEIAEVILEEEHPDMDHWTEDASGDSYLKEESQDLYNDYLADVTECVNLLKEEK